MARRRDNIAECVEEKGGREVVTVELDISKVYLRSIVNGTFTPGRDLMLRMSSYFEKPLEYLFPDLFADNQADLLCPK